MLYLAIIARLPSAKLFVANWDGSSWARVWAMK